MKNKLLMLLFGMAILSGCGQKGSLYIEGADNAEDTAADSAVVEDDATQDTEDKKEEDGTD